MSQQYFDPMPVSESRERTVVFDYRGKTCRCLTDAGTFSRDGLDMGTHLLLESVDDLPPCRVLDLGCGWGPVTVALGQAYPGLEITCLDVNPRALGLAERNAAANGVCATSVLSDGIGDGLGRFDRIFLNPPIRAGKSTVYRLFRDAAAHLKKDGELRIVIRRQQGAESALKALREHFGSVDTVLKKKGYWVIRCAEPGPDDKEGVPS